MSAPRVLVVGSGGREHALLWKLSQSPRSPKLFALPGSTAIGPLAECVTGVDPLNSAAVVEACKEQKIDLVLVGPERPLAAGLADGLRAFGIPVFGPPASSAKLESSKAFAKDFMRRHRVPTAESEVYDDPARAADAAAELELPLVVKADGLAEGKGVRVCRTRREAIAAVQDLMVRGAAGPGGRRVVIERCLEGREASVLLLSDGERLRMLPVSRDHKRLLDGDAGPNTGGMGAYAPVPDVDEALRARVDREILGPISAGLKADGLAYRGVLYCGLMLTADGPRVLEFNVRFGDPETQAILPLLEGDFLSLIESCAAGRLAEGGPRVSRQAALCLVLASEGYPEKPAIGRAIHGLDAAAAEPGVLVFHAGTRRVAEGWLTNGGRVLNVVGVAEDLERARVRAYAAAARIHFDGVQYRRDLAARGAERKVPS